MIVVRPSGARGDIVAAVGACLQYTKERGKPFAPSLAVPEEMVDLAEALYPHQVISLGSLEYVQSIRGKRNSEEATDFWSQHFHKLCGRDHVIALWCPATLYEGSTLKSPPDYNRYQLFALAIGCQHVDHLPVKGPSKDVYDGRVIGIAPRATHKLRCIPQWRATDLVNLAKKNCSQVLYFDSIRKYEFDDAEYVINLPIAELIERLLECSMLITADSFLLHLAYHLGVPVYPVFGPTDLRVYKDFPAGTPECPPCFNQENRKRLDNCDECRNMQRTEVGI
jgi:hypothetical protein